MKKFIITSNIFLLFPVIAAFYAKEWFYFSIALCVSIFSPIYHYLKESNSKYLTLLSLVKDFDWLFAIAAYIYMYYFIFTNTQVGLRVWLAIALSLTLIFFWYGFRFGDYKKTHPWFHIVTALVSGLIVLSK